MRRTLAPVVAVLAIVIGCGTSASNGPTVCGDATCTADQVCMHECLASTCSFAVPSSGQCPAGYAASEATSSQPCCVVAPPPHCVVPAQASQKDCEPTGELMFRQGDDSNEPPVFCVCLI